MTIAGTEVPLNGDALCVEDTGLRGLYRGHLLIDDLRVAVGDVLEFLFDYLPTRGDEVEEIDRYGTSLLGFDATTFTTYPAALPLFNEAVTTRSNNGTGS
ncbi:hypothetical protein BRC90_01860 [Halobacteriales archaeon QS_4_69_34]|nr:MAG: hypothetical protein BRC90_01860 [Halobacteriales archaeon QS_4_69_34]